MRVIGTQAMGIRTPIIKQGDDLVDIVVSSVLKATIEENLTLRDKDVVGVEALLQGPKGNYATVDQIARPLGLVNRTRLVSFPDNEPQQIFAFTERDEC